MSDYRGKGYRVMSPPLIVIWKDEQNGSRSRWAIRGIRPDGSFYGCVTFYQEKKIANLQGKLSEDDNTELWRIADGIRRIAVKADTVDVAPGWDGLIAEGPFHAPRILFHHYPRGSEGSPLGKEFDNLKSLLRPYAERAVGHR